MSTEEQKFYDEYVLIQEDFKKLLEGKVIEQLSMDGLKDLGKELGVLQERRKNGRLELLASETISKEFKTNMRNNYRDLRASIKEKQDEVISTKKTATIAFDGLSKRKEELEDYIRKCEIELADAEARIRNPKGFELSPEQVEQYEDFINKTTPLLREYRKELEEVQKNLDILTKGGKIDRKFVESILDKGTIDKKEELVVENPEDKKDEPKVEKRKEPEEKKDKSETISDPSVDTGVVTGDDIEEARKDVKEETVVIEPGSIESLIEKGTLPKIYPPNHYLILCKNLNININDVTQVLNKDQVDRLVNDYVVQRGRLFQQIYNRNQAKIEEYDKLIAKYEELSKSIESIEDDNLKNEYAQEQVFSSKYKTNFANIIDKLKAERENYVIRNKRIMTLDSSVFDISSEKSRTRSADSKNFRIRESYFDLDQLRSEQEQLKSKFGKRIKQIRINRVLKRIERLRGKTATIATKQTQIINENTDRYIEIVESKLERYLDRVTKYEQSVNNIKELHDRSLSNEEEMTNLQSDIEYARNIFERLGYRIENGKLEREQGRIDRQIDREERAAMR